MSICLNRMMLIAYSRPGTRLKLMRQQKNEAVKAAQRLRVVHALAGKKGARSLRPLEKYLWALEQRGAVRIDGQTLELVLERTARDGGDPLRARKFWPNQRLNGLFSLLNGAKARPTKISYGSEAYTYKYDLKALGAASGNVSLRFKTRHPVLWHMAKEIAAGLVLYEEDRSFVQKAQQERTRDIQIAGMLSRFEYMAGAFRSSYMAGNDLISEIDNFGSSFPAEKVNPSLYFVSSDHHLRPIPHEHTNEFLVFFLTLGTFGASKILNGDFLDFWRDNTDYFRVANRNPIIFRALRKLRQTHYIVGNHDARMVELEDHVGLLDPASGLSITQCFYENGVYIEHGHQSDKHNIFSYEQGVLQENRLGRTVTRALGALSELWPPFWDWAQVVRAALHNPLWDPFKCSEKHLRKKQGAIVKQIRKVYREKSNERLDAGEKGFSPDDPFIYIMGHEHQPLLFELQQAVTKAIAEDPELSGKTQFHFTGAWCERNQYLGNFLIVDTERKWVVPYIWDYGFPLPLVEERGGSN